MRDKWLIWKQLWPLAIAFLLTACSGMGGLVGPQTLSISTAQIQELLVKRIVLAGKASSALGLELQSARVYTMPEQSRIGAEIPVSLPHQMGVDGKSVPAVGVIYLESGLRFESADSTVRLVNPQLKNLKIDGKPVVNMKSLSQILTLSIGQTAISKILNDASVYKLKPEDSRRNGVVWRPGEFRVTSSGVEITFTPE